MVYRGPSKGCQRCKLRRVKCDQTHPSCSNCVRRGVKCVFEIRQDQVRDVNGISFITYRPRAQSSRTGHLKANDASTKSFRSYRKPADGQPSFPEGPLRSAERQKDPTDRGGARGRMLSSTCIGNQHLFQPQVPRGLSMVATKDDRLLHHSVTTYWPGLDPATLKSGHIQPWVEAAMKESHLFECLMWQSSLHRFINNQSPTMKQTALQQNGRAIRSLMSCWPQQVNEVSDTLLFSMISLSIGCALNSKPELSKEESPQPPLTDLWWLNLFTWSPYNDDHLQYIFNIIEARGGLKYLTLPQLPCLVQYIDVTAASMRLGPPKFPLTDQWRFLASLEPRETSFGHIALNYEAQTSRTLAYIKKLPLHSKISEVMLDLKVYALLVERYRTSSVVDPNLSRLGCNRTIIQHRVTSLLSLDFSDELDQVTSASDLNSAARLGLLVFSLGVTYPLACKKPLRAATDKLKAALEPLYDCRSVYIARGEPIYLWLCTIGAISSPKASSTRLWFEERMLEMEVSRLTKQPPGAFGGSRSWLEIKSILEDIIWMSCSCDKVAERVWGRVETGVDLYSTVSSFL